jgi:hypothetical protein
MSGRDQVANVVRAVRLGALASNVRRPEKGGTVEALAYAVLVGLGISVLAAFMVSLGK